MAEANVTTPRRRASYAVAPDGRFLQNVSADDAAASPITVLSPRTGEILGHGGQFYPSPTTARLAGASLGGCFLKQHGICVGFCMELQDEGRTIVTTAVHSIRRVGHDRVQ